MISTHLVCNRLVKEDWEDREYAIHLRKINDIKNRKSVLGSTNNSNSSSSSVKFPHLFSNPKRAQKMQEQKYEIERELHLIEQKIGQIKTNVDHKNPYYEKAKNKEAGRNKFKSDIDLENERLAKKLANVKGMYNFDKSMKDYEHHRSLLKISSKKFYTPRGMGHRKVKSLPDVKQSRRKSKNAIKLLNEAVNQLERGDVVLMKTLVKLNYLERMETKRKYEKTYETDLKKGLLKVMDKQYEPLVQALLTDVNLVDVDRIYESLYDQNDAANVITECFISRSLEQKTTLLLAFHQKMDSELKIEISSKIEGDLKTFLLAFLENDNLDTSHLDEHKLKKDIKNLENLTSFTSNNFIDVIKIDSKKQLKKLFDEYQQTYTTDIFSKADQNKPAYKAVKLIQTYLLNPNLYLAEKLQRNLKSNKPEFLRLLATLSQKELDQMSKEYTNKYQTKLKDDVRLNFSNDVARLVLKMLDKNNSSDDEND